MLTRTQANIAYLVFLFAFAAFKYLGAAPAQFSSGYAISVTVLVVLTGVLPYAIARWLAGRHSHTGSRWATALVVGSLLCCAGYAGYWVLFIQPSGASVPVTAVALRGLIAGPIEGVLAALWVAARR